MSESSYTLRKKLRDKAMRKALLKILQEATKEYREGYPTFPEPSRSDDQITEELHRILNIRKGWFR
jgi:hypothetical protein